MALGDLQVELLEDSITWFDTGTHQSLFEASQFIQEKEKQQGIKIGCIEEVAYRKGFISREQLTSLAHTNKE
mgnify:CR=1 FL=1